MVDVASIVVAVISFVGALVAAGFTAWFTYFSDERKRLSESEKLIAKYRDPLLLACQDLQSRLYNITDQGISKFFRMGGEQKKNLLLYTARVSADTPSSQHLRKQDRRLDADNLFGLRMCAMLSRETTMYSRQRSGRNSWIVQRSSSRNGQGIPSAKYLSPSAWSFSLSKGDAASRMLCAMPLSSNRSAACRKRARRIDFLSSGCASIHSKSMRASTGVIGTA